MDKQLLLEKSDKEIIMILSDKGEHSTLMKSVEKTLQRILSGIERVITYSQKTIK